MAVVEKPENESFYKKTINSWALYHWAENGFGTAVMVAVLPVYYSKVAASGLTPNQATVYWGYTTTIALILVAILAPILGTIANLIGIRKRLLMIFAAIGVVSSASFYFVKTGDWLLASAIFIVGNIAFALADVFHDSFLPHISKESDIDRVSSRGFAAGYLGGGIILIISIAIIQLMSDKGLAARLTFITSAIWWAVFTIPLILNVREPGNTGTLKGNAILVSLKELSKTFHNVKHYRQLSLFLLAFLIYNDGIYTIFKMATIYGAELGLNQNTLIGSLLLALIVGFPSAIFFGWLAKSIGAKKCIYICLLGYSLISIGGFFISKPIDFWILGAAVGVVMGGAQALSRSYFGSMVPKSKTAEFFGFYGMSSRIGGFLGPLVFALVGQLMGNSRYAIISLLIFFIVGIILLINVDEKEGIKIAKQEDMQTSN
ncbi:MAG: MFS transporter [Thermodesulfobacteriota bacterium]|nr:MAG: MFS transporter [Thermodesulfobacteriota bacterium]